jgi:hypothetical protein
MESLPGALVSIWKRQRRTGAGGELHARVDTGQDPKKLENKPLS